ncbi:hypothetical protein L873DRAFT_1798630 [Choiromyces venosus 120613-1]|uniref:Uncharacterized protein n=1 Tax=Choiromyces venosus 120613-1 TaxID=1336337 RepID=A0A3N4K2M8_9PEZI|nr:hypothetical protein L873DRAFT_1798630 [Choiromyces venosus 120613-1]
MGNLINEIDPLALHQPGLRPLASHLRLEHQLSNILSVINVGPLLLLVMVLHFKHVIRVCFAP